MCRIATRQAGIPLQPGRSRFIRLKDSSVRLHGWRSCLYQFAVAIERVGQSSMVMRSSLLSCHLNMKDSFLIIRRVFYQTGLLTSGRPRMHTVSSLLSRAHTGPTLPPNITSIERRRGHRGETVEDEERDATPYLLLKTSK